MINNKNASSKMKVSKNFYLFFIIMILAIGYIIAKDVSLPRYVTGGAVVLGGFILTLSSFINPNAPFFILIAYLPFSKILIGQLGTNIVGFNLSNILMILAFVGWISVVMKRRQKFLNSSSLNPVLAVFCIWSLLSVLGARYYYGAGYDTETFIILLKRWVTPIMLAYISCNIVRDKQTFKKTLFIMLIVVFVVSLMAIRDYLNTGAGGNLEDSRIGGVFQQPNMLGGFFVYNMFLFVSFFLYYIKKIGYWIMLGMFLACFRAIMATFSRGSYLAFAFGGLMLTFFRNKFLFFLTIVFTVFILLNPSLLPEGIRYRLASTFGGGEVISTDINEITDSSARTRIEIWKAAVEMIKDKPLFGFGYGTFPFVIGAYNPNVQGRDAHNTYLILAAEMGIPALIIFLVILFIMIKNSAWLLKNCKEKYFKAFALGMLANIFALIVVNMFGSRMNAEEVSAYFWVYAGLIMAAVRMKKRGEIE